MYLKAELFKKLKPMASRRITQAREHESCAPLEGTTPALCAAGSRMGTVDGMTADWFFVTPFVVALSQQASVILIAHTSIAVNQMKPKDLGSGYQSTSLMTDLRS